MIRTILILSLLIPVSLFADENSNSLADRIFSVKDIEKKGELDKKWFFKIDSSLQDKKGNTNSIIGSGATELKHSDGIITGKIGFSFSYNENANTIIYNKLVIENKGNGYINFDYQFSNRWELFSFCINEYDRLALLTYRNYTGVGPKFYIFNSDYLLMDISYAPTFKYERFDTFSPLYTLVHSIRYRVDIYFWKKLDLQFFCYYLPIYNFSNYRVIFETSLGIDVVDLQLTKKSGIAFKFGYRREYTSIIPEGTKNTDSIIFTKLIFFI